MSQRESGYERKELDLYETPEWVTETLIPYLSNRALHVWEPAAGNHKMAGPLIQAGFRVATTDIQTGTDFLKQTAADESVQAIVTNPPYSLAKEFIEHALNLMKYDGLVAMLLRTDFDHAKTRQHLFGGCRAFAQKLVLTKRIIWFDGPKAAPSFNHAWYVWDWRHKGPPTLAYGP